MSRRTLKSDDVEGFMLAAWDELEDVGKDYGCIILLDVRRSVFRGKWTFHAVATYTDDRMDERPCGAAEVEWPSHKYTSVHAALYSLACKVSIAITRDHRERTGDWLTQAEITARHSVD